MTLTPALCTCGQAPKTHDCIPNSPGHAAVYCGHPCRLEARGHDLEDATKRWHAMILKRASAEIVDVYLRARLLGEVHPHGGLSWNVESSEPAPTPTASAPTPPVIAGPGFFGVSDVSNTAPDTTNFSLAAGTSSISVGVVTRQHKQNCGSIRNVHAGVDTELVVPKWLAEQAFVPAFQQAAADFNRLLKVLHSCGYGVMEALASPPSDAPGNLP